MPNIKSAKKRVKVIEVKSKQNKMLKSALKTNIKKADIAIQSSAQDSAVALKMAIINIDKAVTKGILHKNTAARKKSRLTVKFNAKQA
jgi:small subunit ribosomal protein S20